MFFLTSTNTDTYFTSLSFAPNEGVQVPRVLFTSEGMMGVRLTGESEQRVRCCMSFTARLWWKGSWAERQSSRSTGQSSSLPSPMVMSDGSRVPPGRLPREVFLARPRTRWRDYISSLAWELLGIPQSGLAYVAGEREVWDSAEAAAPRPDFG